jgi:hypothetical protein
LKKESKMQMEVPGKPNLKFRLLEETDHPKLQEFCDKCKDLGWKNNSSFEDIKLDKMIMPYGQYFIGYDDQKEQIWNLLGVHHLPEIHKNAWRIFFRGAQLPGYRLGNKLTTDIFKIGYQITYIVEMQIKFIQQYKSNAEFYCSTNTPNAKKFARSQFLDQVVAPQLEERGVLSKEYENFNLFHTDQTIWKLNIEKYFEERKKSVGF